MVFLTTTLFKHISCPEGQGCHLTNCIYGHDVLPKATHTSAVPVTTQDRMVRQPVEPPRKRQKLTFEKLEDKPPSRAEQIKLDLAAARDRKVLHPASETQNAASKTSQADPTPPSLKKPISPPLPGCRTNGKAPPPKSVHGSNSHANTSNVKVSQPASAITSVASTEKQSLNPRLIVNDPAGHAKRTIFLKYMHAEMTRLNKTVANAAGTTDSTHPPSERPLVLKDSELVTLSLDEEEQLARNHGNVYENVIKNRIAAYKKMRTEEWTKVVNEKFKPANDALEPAAKGVKPVETGLTSNEELSILQHLVIKDQKSLTKHGYVPTPPTAAEAEEAALAVEISRNYEICDRCSTRFQVFPNRNEEGLLTSNGTCQYHPKRKVTPQKAGKAKSHLIGSGTRDAYFPCCNEDLGSKGCTESQHHVFKTSSPARLAAVLPFVITPENLHPAKDLQGHRPEAVAFDCEMGYTTLGLELIRLTAVSWPEGKTLIDVLVRPLGIVLDLNSHFSGVWPEHYTAAVPFKTWLTEQYASQPLPQPQDGEITKLPLVDRPQNARELLCSFLTPKTPLIGHAIENDLNTTRLCHPSIVDTIVLFPHPRGLPMRQGLKMLSSRHLHRAIQQGGERGHDSAEDAIAAGDLVRVKVGEKWKKMKAQGWRFLEGQLTSPAALNHNGAQMSNGKAEAGEKGAGVPDRKRKREGELGMGDSEDEDWGTDDKKIDQATDAS